LAVIGIRALVTAGIAVAAMLSLQGCIGVGDSWSHEAAAAPSTAPATVPPSAPTTASPSPNSSAGGAWLNGAPPTSGPARVERVSASVSAIGNLGCGGTVTQPITVTAELTGGITPAAVRAAYSMTGGGYTGQVTMTRQPSGRYAANLPALEKKHFTSASTNIYITVTADGAGLVAPGHTSITIQICAA
jgi:hypothetical protein